jgi:hypothetical protein
MPWVARQRRSVLNLPDAQEVLEIVQEQQAGKRSQHSKRQSNQNSLKCSTQRHVASLSNTSFLTLEHPTLPILTIKMENSKFLICRNRKAAYQQQYY